MLGRGKGDFGGLFFEIQRDIVSLEKIELGEIAAGKILGERGEAGERVFFLGVEVLIHCQKERLKKVARGIPRQPSS